MVIYNILSSNKYFLKYLMLCHYVCIHDDFYKIGMKYSYIFYSKCFFSFSTKIQIVFTINILTTTQNRSLESNPNKRIVNLMLTIYTKTQNLTCMITTRLLLQKSAFGFQMQEMGKRFSNIFLELQR